MKGKKIKEAIGKYGEIIRKGDIVNPGTYSGKVKKIIREKGEDFIFVYDCEDKKIKKEKAVNCSSYMYDEIVKRWVEHDKLKGVHKYTRYKDIDGVQLAENMVLRNVYKNDEHGYEYRYYVTKNEKGKYILKKVMNSTGEEILKIEEARKEFAVIVFRPGPEIKFLNR